MILKPKRSIKLTTAKWSEIEMCPAVSNESLPDDRLDVSMDPTIWEYHALRKIWLERL